MDNETYYAELDWQTKSLNETIDKIRAEWAKWKIQVESISNDVTLYSGRYNNNGEQPSPRGESIWMSESAFYAGEYCYMIGSAENAVRYLYKVKLKEAVDIAVFPVTLHPADVFKVDPHKKIDYVWRNDLSSMGMPPDSFVSKYWKDIVNGTDMECCSGHARLASNRDIESLGATEGGYIEFWLNDASLLEIVDQKEMPGNKDLYHSVHCDNRYKVNLSVFGQ